MNIEKEKWWHSIDSGSGGGAFRTADRVVMRNYQDFEGHHRSEEVCIIPANPHWGEKRYAQEVERYAVFIASAPAMFSALIAIAEGSEPAAAKIASDILDRKRLCLVGPAREARDNRIASLIRAGRIPDGHSA